MAARNDLTAEYVRSILDYNPETGEFRWKSRTPEMFAPGNTSAEANCRAWNNKNAWKLIYHSSGGYNIICIGKKYYKAHRLAWLYMTGEWPEDEIDHRDTDRGNNRWENLREATSSENKCNRRKKSDNTSGVKGVSFHRQSGKWRVRVQKDGLIKVAVLVSSREEAAVIYECMSMRIHGEFARTE